MRTLHPPARVHHAGPRALAAVLALGLLGCSGPQQTAGDSRAERRARRASARVRGPGDGAGGSGTAAAPTGTAPAASGKAPAAIASRHPIMLNPPSTPGERSRERSEVRFSNEQFVRVDGNEIAHKKSDVIVRFEGDARVVEVDADGVPVVTEYTVVTAVADVEGATRDIAQKGDVVVVRRKGPEPRIEGPAGPYKGPDGAAMELLFTTSDPGVSEDRVFGTSRMCEVGDSWPIDASAAAQDLSAGGKIRVDSSNVSGQTTLVAARSCGQGQTCLTVRSEMDVGSFELTGMPPGATLRDSGSRVRIEQTHPVKVRSHRAEGKLDMLIHTVIGMTRDDKDVELETRIHTVQTAISEPR